MVFCSDPATMLKTSGLFCTPEPGVAVVVVAVGCELSEHAASSKTLQTGIANARNLNIHLSSPSRAHTRALPIDAALPLKEFVISLHITGIHHYVRRPLRKVCNERPVCSTG